MTTRYFVRVQSGGHWWFLRHTTWTSEVTRASTYETEEAAREALQKVKPFTKPALIKKASVAPCDG